MILHILNGDGLRTQFVEVKIEGEPLVFRECLIEGPISGPDRDLFWAARADYLERTHGAAKEDYFNGFVDSISRLARLGRSDEVNLWFGDDLFCQANLWCCLDLLKNTGARVFRVFPSGIDFGAESADDLKRAFDGRVEFGDPDMALGCELWESFVSREPTRFAELSGRQSAAFRRLGDVCLAASELGFRPLEVVRQIVAETGDDFPTVFGEFRKREPIYGLGDVQVKRLLDRISR